MQTPPALAPSDFLDEAFIESARANPVSAGSSCGAR